MLNGVLQGVIVAPRAQAANDADGGIGKIGMVTEGFTGMHIGQVHFHKGNLHGQQGVTHGHRSVRERRRIDDDERGAIVPGCLDAVDQHAFMIALQGVEVMTVLHRMDAEPGVDILEGDGAVNARLTRTEQVQVGAVQQQNPGHSQSVVVDGGNLPPYGRKITKFSNTLLIFAARYLNWRCMAMNAINVLRSLLDMKTLWGRFLPGLFLLPAVAAEEESLSQNIELPPMAIDYSGVAEAIFHNQLLLLGGSVLAAACVLAAIGILTRNPARNATAAALGRVWGMVYLLLLGSLAVAGMRVWLLLQG